MEAQTIVDEKTGVISTDPVVYVGSAVVVPVQNPNGLIEVVIEGVTIKATQEQWDSMKSDVPYEDGLVMIRKWKPTIAKVLSVLTQDNLTMNDKDFVMQRVDQSILQNYRSAVSKLFGVEGQEDVSMQQIIDIVSPKV
jgi:hypothetical protein